MSCQSETWFPAPVTKQVSVNGRMQVTSRTQYVYWVRGDIQTTVNIWSTVPFWYLKSHEVTDKRYNFNMQC